MGRIGEWAREIGPQRLGFGLATIALAYLRFGLSLAGYQADNSTTWMVALPILAFICALVSGWKIMPFSRFAYTGGLAHAFIVLMWLLLFWSFPGEPGLGIFARPQHPDDFRLYFYPSMALVWASAALMRQVPRGVAD